MNFIITMNALEADIYQDLYGAMILPPSFHSLIKDKLIEGCNILLNGLPGIGKTIFCENMVNECIKNDCNCVWVTIDKTPEKVIENLNNGMGLNKYMDKDKITFIDGYSWLIGKTKGIYGIENLSNLTELNFRIVGATSSMSKPFLLVFDSISPLTLYNQESHVMKFLQLLLAKIKELDGIGIFIVQEGVHSDVFYNTLGYLVDGIFEMRMVEAEEEIKRYFRIRNINCVSHKTNWVPFTIEENREIKMLSDGGANHA